MHPECFIFSPLVAYTYAKRAASTMKRNAVAIKQEILYFCTVNTKEYEVHDCRWRFVMPLKPVKQHGS